MPYKNPEDKRNHNKVYHSAHKEQTADRVRRFRNRPSNSPSNSPVTAPKLSVIEELKRRTNEILSNTEMPKEAQETFDDYKIEKVYDS